YYDNATTWTSTPTVGNPTLKKAFYQSGSSLDTSTFYDTYGHVTKVTNPRSNPTTTSYDSATQRFPYPVTDALNETVSKTYNTMGQVLSSTDINNQVTNYQYDALNRLIKFALPGDTLASPTYSASYAATSTLSVVTTNKKAPSGSGTINATYFYD